MALEGELHLRLSCRGGRVQAVQIGSSRPDVAQALLQGRSRAEAEAAVPRLFALCGRSQAAVSEGACAAAAAGEPLAAATAATHSAVAAEMLRETAWHLLLNGPRMLGETPHPDAVAVARAAQTWLSPAQASEAARAIAQAAFGMDTGAWLALRTPDALEAWAAAGGTATARFIHHMLQADAVAAPAPAAAPARIELLPAQGHARWVLDLAPAITSDTHFSRQPRWQGRAAETGALARRQGDALIAALRARTASRLAARGVARLQELALLLSGQLETAIGACSLPGGTGLAWVENARGLLIHQVSLVQGRVQSYRIVAPTEWNFHPDGALVQGLLDSPADDAAALRQRATWLVHSLDPCVACQIELCDA